MNNSFADDPARWLVVYNTANADSVTWAESYRQSRGVPYANLLGLELSTAEQISQAAFLTMRQAIASYLTDNALDDQILGILCGHGVPGQYTRDDGQAEAIAGQLHDLQGSTDPIANPLAPIGETVVARPERGNLGSLRLTARIDGPTLADSQALTTRAESIDFADGEQSKIWLDAHATDAPFYESRTQHMLEWADSPDRQRLRLPLEITADGQSQDVQFPAISEDAFFWGWDQAVVPSGFFAEPAGPRAFCLQLHYNGATAPTLRNPGDNSWAVSALQAGYAAAAGATRSFTPTAVPLVRPFFQALRSGWTLAEAWFVANPLLRVGLMLVGDPLMTVSLPRGGWDVYGPFESWHAARFDQPIAHRRPSQKTLTLDVEQQPAEGESALYIVRHVDAQGRTEAGFSHVLIQRNDQQPTEPPAVPAWPGAPGWSPRQLQDQWRLSALWARRFGASNITRIELIEQVQGEVEQVVRTRIAEPEQRDVFFEQAPAGSPVRYRIKTTSSDQAEAYSPWSKWLTLQQPAPVSIQTLEGAFYE